MKIVIAKSELDKVFAYEKYKDNDPCKQCGDDAHYCCGCFNQINYEKRLKALKTYDPKIDEVESIQNYIKMWIRADDIKNNISKLENDLEKLYAEINEAKNNFIIEEME